MFIPSGFIIHWITNVGGLSYSVHGISNQLCHLDEYFILSACFWGFYDVVKTLLDKGAGIQYYHLTVVNIIIFLSRS